MEWKNKYNSFNSDKGLMYYENYKHIIKWLDGAKYLPPPVEVNVDPFSSCNLDCYFCIVQRYIKHNRSEIGDMTQLPLEYLIKLVDFISNWGVKGLCISGGGEPTLHKGLPKLIDYAKDKMDVAVVTNATNLFDELLYCRWVALSVDASSRSTYTKIKGKDKFDEVTKNIYDLAKKRNTKTDLCFKFLIVPENQYEVYTACKLAKELGVQDFHARPVDFERTDIEGAKPLKMDIKDIYEQFEMCHTLGSESFHVYTVTHKFDSNFHVKHDFDKCLAAPMILPILTDGNGYLCVEHKMDAKYKLGSAYPNPESILDWWGGDKHREMIKGIVPDDSCSRCIYGAYHKQIEAVEKDSMCANFP